MHLPDPDRSHAVLIGVSDYAHLPTLPSVLNSVDELAACLRDPQLWGLPASNCTVVHNPTSQDVLLDAIHDAAEMTQDFLLVYFAGHGLIDPFSGELLLGLVGSVRGKSYKAVQYEQVKRILGDAGATRRVSILDCCYSGKAIAGMADPASAVADEMSAKGTLVLASAPGNKQALSPEGEQYTAFTGEVIKLLRNGIPNGPENISLQDIFRHTSSELVAKSRPRPQMRTDNTVASVSLVRNQSWRPAPPSEPQLIDRQPSPASPISVPGFGRIWVSVLGEPLVFPVDGGDPEGRELILTELAVLLATHPDGVSDEDIDAKMWPRDTDRTYPQKAAEAWKSQRRIEHLMRLRKWMGKTTTGEYALVKSEDTSGRVLHKLHPDVLCDWLVWQKLVDQHPFHVDADHLWTALNMVRSRPFVGTYPTAYRWAEYLRQETISAITCVAEELASRHIRGQRAPFDLAKARTAAEIGIAVDRVDQAVWRCGIIATHFSGAPDAVRLTQDWIDQMFVELDSLELTPDEETLELFDRLAKYEHGATYRLPGGNDQ